jgi:hypothetical protein
MAFPLAQLAGWTPMFGPVLDWTAWQIGILVCGQVLLPLLFGLLLARFSNGRPMTVCIASAVVGQGLITALQCHSAWTLMEELTLTDKLFYLFNLDLKTHAFISTVIAIPMIAAGYLYRRRALRREMAH